MVLNMPSILDLLIINLLLVLLLLTTSANGQGTRRSPAQEIMYIKNKFREEGRGSAVIKGPDFAGGIGINGYTRPIADKVTTYQKGKARTESTTYRI